MRSRHEDNFFRYFISGMDSKMQAQLSLMYTRWHMMDEYYHRQEMEQMKKEIAEDVLSRISATVDVTEVIQEIEGLRQELDKLYGMFA
ncbi:hypothetical protein SDC9_36716 [bioreactor metagenome]|uniref:Uncharacterized protein n=1 Tax=bioreactor metagenome TaxID=1076179 RepID=A0A644VJ17_9ZZZZ